MLIAFWKAIPWPGKTIITPNRISPSNLQADSANYIIAEDFFS